MQTKARKIPSIKMVQSMRKMGYNNYDAIFDIVDNSIDAEASKVIINVEKGPKNTVRNILIADDGSGMQPDLLLEAVRLGSETEHKMNDLGKFGMGLSTASLSLTEKMTATSMTPDTELHTVLQDLSVMEHEGDYVYPISESSAFSIQKFFDTLGDNVNSGTVIYLQDCDNVKHRFDTFVANMTERLSRQFRGLINNGLKIVLNGVVIKSQDFLQREVKGTRIRFDDMINISYTNFKGELVEGKIRVVIAKLGSSSYNLSQANQGFSIIRNGREIKFNERLGLWAKHPSYNAIRGELYFSNSLDECMGINVDKSKIDIDEEVETQIKDQIFSVIQKIKKELSQEADLRKREKEREEGKTPDHKDSTKRIETIETKRTPKKKAKGIKSKQAPVSWSQGNHGSHAPIFQSYKQGKSLVVEYNMDHEFYDQFVMGTQHEKELRTAVDLLIYTMASQKESYGSDEFSNEVLEEYLQGMSLKLKRLLDKE